MVRNSPPTSASDKRDQDDDIKTSISVEEDENNIKNDTTAAAGRDGGFLVVSFTMSHIRQTWDSHYSLIAAYNPQPNRASSLTLQSSSTHLTGRK